MSLKSYLARLGRAIVGRPESRGYWTPESPLSNPDEWQTDRWKAESGVTVNEYTALQHGPVWRAVNLISSDVARIPIMLYKRDGEDRERYTDDPLYRLLRRRPNRYMTAFVFKKQMTADYLLWGNAYAYIQRDGNSRPAALLRLAPWMVNPKRDTDGVLYYDVHLDEDGRSSRPIQVDARDMFHLRGIGSNECGMSVITMARHSLSLGIATRQHGAKYFERGSRPTFIIEVPDTIGDDGVKLIKDQFPKKYGGLEKQHIPIVLDKGAKGTPFTTSNEDAQFLGSREFDLIEVSHWFNIPPGKLGHPGRTSYASVEQENLSYLDSLDPHFVMFEQEGNDKLLSQEQIRADMFFLEFIREALVRVDLKTQWEVYREALYTGAMNRDEVRARANMSPMPDGLGAIYYYPTNMGNAEALKEPPAPPAPPPPDPAQVPPDDPNNQPDPDTPPGGTRAAVRDLLQRCLGRLGNAATRKLGDQAAYMKLLTEGLGKYHSAAIADMAGPILGLEASFPSAATFADELLERAQAQLHEVTDAGEIKARLAELATTMEKFVYQEEQ